MVMQFKMGAVCWVFYCKQRILVDKEKYKSWRVGGWGSEITHSLLWHCGDISRIFLPLWHISDVRNINNEEDCRWRSLCIVDGIICWFSWAWNCWKIILSVPLSEAWAWSNRKSALPESDNHYKMNFVLWLFIHIIGVGAESVWKGWWILF